MSLRDYRPVSHRPGLLNASRPKQGHLFGNVETASWPPNAPHCYNTTNKLLWALTIPVATTAIH